MEGGQWEMDDGDWMEKDPPAGFAPASAGLQNRCLAEIGHRGVKSDGKWLGGLTANERQWTLIVWNDSHGRLRSCQDFQCLIRVHWRSFAVKKWCGIPVLPWRSLGGSQTCSLLHQYRRRFEMADHRSADLPSALRLGIGRQSWNCTGLVASSARCSSV